MSIEAAVTTPGPLVHLAAVPPAPVAPRHRAGGLGRGSIHPPTLCLDRVPCPYILPHGVRSPGVTPQFWLPCHHPIAPGPLVLPHPLQCQVPHFSSLLCRYDPPQHRWGLHRCPMPSQGSLGAGTMGNLPSGREAEWESTMGGLYGKPC